MFCTHCGVKLNEDSKFCTACGTPVAGTAPQAHLAETHIRLINFFLDSIFSVAFVFAIVMIFSLIFQPKSSGALAILYYMLYPAYYVLFEAIWQRTPAKFITKSKVVRFDGTKPGFGSIVLRTLVRYIPFEAFSFLFSAAGWHDRWAGTLVVPVSYSPEEVRAINIEEKSRKSHVLLIVIIILVVGIAVVGILSSVVLVSLNSARSKARDAQRLADVRQIQTALELYYNDAGGYPSSLPLLEPSYVTLPVPPTPPDGNCTTIANEYGYTPSMYELNDALQLGYNSYDLTFCLGSEAGGFYAGGNIVSPP